MQIRRSKRHSAMGRNNGCVLASSRAAFSSGSHVSGGQERPNIAGKAQELQLTVLPCRDAFGYPRVRILQDYSPARKRSTLHASGCNTNSCDASSHLVPFESFPANPPESCRRSCYPVLRPYLMSLCTLTRSQKRELPHFGHAGNSVVGREGSGLKSQAKRALARGSGSPACLPRAQQGTQTAEDYL